jgi:hypothetical protein
MLLLSAKRLQGNRRAASGSLGKQLLLMCGWAALQQLLAAVAMLAVCWLIWQQQLSRELQHARAAGRHCWPSCLKNGVMGTR